MKKTALVILGKDNDQNDMKSFLDDRGILSDTHDTGRSALTAFKATRYPYVFVSMDIEREDPIEIIGQLRLAEQKLGRLSTQVFVAGNLRQPSVSDLEKYNICGVIRSHRM
jgi:ActR/RegA family two-component response regulator